MVQSSAVRRPMVVANYKAGTPDQSVGVGPVCDRIKELTPHMSKGRRPIVVVAPPFTALDSAYLLLPDKHGLQLAAQDISPGVPKTVDGRTEWSDTGARTGAITGPMLREIRCTYVLIGHSETRIYDGVTDALVAAKINAALRNEIIPIICIGETLEERGAGQTRDILIQQIRGAFGGVDVTHPLLAQAAIAYEPVWAIGTGRTPTDDQIAAAATYVNEGCGLLTLPRSISTLYGGSVKTTNAEKLARIPGLDGLLVGGASLVSNDFLAIVDAVEKNYRG